MSSIFEGVPFLLKLPGDYNQDSSALVGGLAAGGNAARIRSQEKMQARHEDRLDRQEDRLMHQSTLEEEAAMLRINAMRTKEEMARRNMADQNTMIGLMPALRNNPSSVVPPQFNDINNAITFEKMRNEAIEGEMGLTAARMLPVDKRATFMAERMRSQAEQLEGLGGANPESAKLRGIADHIQGTFGPSRAVTGQTDEHKAQLSLAKSEFESTVSDNSLALGTPEYEEAKNKYLRTIRSLQPEAQSGSGAANLFGEYGISMEEFGQTLRDAAQSWRQGQK